MQRLAHEIYSFGEFRIDLTRGALYRGNEELKLRPKSFDVLKYLTENQGRLVSKDEIIETVWQETAVTDDSLVQCLKDIRRALSDNSKEIIRTVPRRGYIFEKNVNENSGSTILTEDTSCVRFVIEETVEGGGDGSEFSTLRMWSKSSTLLGREKEIVGIKNLLRRDDVQIATLTGAGGTGKTRLAQAVAHDCSLEFPDGAFFVELADVNESAIVPSALATTLGVRETRGRTLVENLISFLRGKRLLLVLDNFEQIISAAPLITHLTDSLPKLKILITSRSSLGLSNEYELIVPPLAVPPTNSRMTIDEVTKYSAVKLFVSTAQAANPVFTLQEGNAQVICGICARLDGLPLAIELAAARSKLLSPSAILDRLENGLKLLSSRTMGLPSRQQTMRGVVKWSYDLLDENEKILFTQLSVFSGGMTIEAVEAVAESPENDGQDVLDLVESLIDKNLLVAKTKSDGETRLRMLAVIREFAAEKLENSGLAEENRCKHAEYYFAMADAAEIHLQTAQAGEWLNRLEEEHYNLRASIHWLFENDAKTAARLAASIRIYLINRSHLTEGREWLNTALKQSDELPVTVRFKLLNLLGWLALTQGDYPAARKIHQENLVEARKASDKTQLAESLRGLGAAVQSQGDYASARKFHEEGLKVHREVNDAFGIAASLNGVGSVMLAGGDVTEAQPFLKESLTIFRKLGNESGICYCLMNLGEAAYLCEDYDTSNECFAEVLTLARSLEYRDRVSFCLDGFAALSAERRAWKRSARLAGAAEQLRFTIGYEPETQVREFRSKYLEKVCGVLGETVFAETIQEGRALKLEEAIELTKIPLITDIHR